MRVIDTKLGMIVADIYYRMKSDRIFCSLGGIGHTGPLLFKKKEDVFLYDTGFYRCVRPKWLC